MNETESTNIANDPEQKYTDNSPSYQNPSAQDNILNTEEHDTDSNNDCEEIFGISTFLYETSYPCNEHLEFWKNINDKPIEIKSDNRYVQKEIFEDIFNEKNDLTTRLFGISYTRTSSIFNYERDFIYQYYSMGIIGVIILLLPLVIIPIKKYIKLKKNNKPILLCTLILVGISFEYLIAFLSGNTIDNLSILFPLGILIGIIDLPEKEFKNTTTLIPKTIHYVWVGNSKKNRIIKKCMSSWKKYLSEYKVIEWNEKNFDMNSHPFLKTAYAEKKWAFVSDYIRAYVIYHEGGIYLDTDVLLLDNFDSLLNNDAFVGFENKNHPFTAVFGAKTNHPFIKKTLDYYDNLKTYDFNFDSNNTISVSNILISEYKCKKNNKFQILKDNIAVYPDTILCNPSKDSIAIHIFTGTWLKDKKSLKNKLIAKIKVSIHSKFSAEAYRKILSRKIK